MYFETGDSILKILEIEPLIKDHLKNTKEMLLTLQKIKKQLKIIKENQKLIEMPQILLVKEKK